MPGCEWSCPSAKRTTVIYHKNKHYPSYKCADCDAVFPQKAQLDVHTRTRHTRERPYSCAHCEQTFIQLSNLQDHERKRHAKEAFYAKEKEAILAAHPDISGVKLGLLLNRAWVAAGTNAQQTSIAN